MNRGTVACWLGLGLWVVASGGDQATPGPGWVFWLGLALVAVGLLRWKPWQGGGWA